MCRPLNPLISPSSPARWASRPASWPGPMAGRVANGPPTLEPAGRHPASRLPAPPPPAPAASPHPHTRSITPGLQLHTQAFQTVHATNLNPSARCEPGRTRSSPAPLPIRIGPDDGGRIFRCGWARPAVPEEGGGCRRLFSFGSRRDPPCDPAPSRRPKGNIYIYNTIYYIYI